MVELTGRDQTAIIQRFALQQVCQGAAVGTGTWEQIQAAFQKVHARPTVGRDSQDSNSPTSSLTSRFIVLRWGGRAPSLMPTLSAFPTTYRHSLCPTGHAAAPALRSFAPTLLSPGIILSHINQCYYSSCFSSLSAGICSGHFFQIMSQVRSRAEPVPRGKDCLAQTRGILSHQDQPCRYSTTTSFHMATEEHEQGWREHEEMQWFP